MAGIEHQIGMLTLAACALAAWWLGVRPGSTFRSLAPTMSVLIVLMAVMMLVVTLDGWSGRVPGAPRAALLAP